MHETAVYGCHASTPILLLLGITAEKERLDAGRTRSNDGVEASMGS
jgi:hypothetical protein